MVLCCTNTSTKVPSKLFCKIPNKFKNQKLWLRWYVYDFMTSLNILSGNIFMIILIIIIILNYVFMSFNEAGLRNFLVLPLHVVFYNQNNKFHVTHA